MGVLSLPVRALRTSAHMMTRSQLSMVCTESACHRPRAASTAVQTDNPRIITETGRVSPLRDVPQYIPRPPYIKKGLFSTDVLSKFTAIHKKIEIKNEQQIAGMRAACQLARSVLNTAADIVTPGVTTEHIDDVVHNTCLHHGAYPSTLRYRDFPKSVCTSINNVACHGIPDDRLLQNGDIINIDVTVFYNGFHGDVSETYLVGDVDDQWRHLVEATRWCRDVAISICSPGTPFNHIGHVIQLMAKEEGYNVIPHFCGHGIGSYFHGLPDIYHVVNDEPGEMEEGMTFTIEPILTVGDGTIKILPDGWTAVTCDNSWTAQFEHTILITREGHEVLTQ